MAVLLKVKWVDKPGETGLHQRIQHIGRDSMKLQCEHMDARAIEFIECGLLACVVGKDAASLNRIPARTTDSRKYLTI